MTLTYADDPGTLNGDDLSGFMKRYRHHYGACRYFGVGEYGGKMGRGHWHLIIFGHDPEVSGRWTTNKAWEKGFSYDGECNATTIGYVAGYVLKSDLQNLQRMPLSRMSLRPGIGAYGIEQLARAAAVCGIQKWPTEYRIGGRRYPICEGGLAMFKRLYLSVGGMPPKEAHPASRHLVTLAELKGSGGLRTEQSRRRVLHDRRSRDEYAQKTKR